MSLPAVGLILSLQLASKSPQSAALASVYALTLNAALEQRRARGFDALDLTQTRSAANVPPVAALTVRTLLSKVQSLPEVCLAPYI